MKQSRFFLYSSLTFLALVFIGFAPSFYLKFLVADQPYYPHGLPMPYILHGGFLTIWYIFLVVQTSLIDSKNISSHRRLGYFGAAWAGLVLVSTFWAISLFPDRMEQLASETGQTLDTVEPGLAMILWMDVLMSLFFVGAVSLGIANRNHPMVHKRLMFFAGLVYLFAATSRVGGTLGLLLDMELGPAPGFVLLLALSLALPIHDRRKLGKIPKTTWLCFCLYWLAILLSVVLGNIEWGENLVFSIFKST